MLKPKAYAETEPDLRLYVTCMLGCTIDSA
jgi:hypothetical protein